MLKKSGIIYFFAGVALMPVCIAATYALLETFSELNSLNSSFRTETTALCLGYLTWLTVWFFLPRPSGSYILAHELTHALWGLVFGADVKKINITEKGGSVTLSKTNLWITLSPYFFPFYTFLVIIIWYITSFFINPVPWAPVWHFFIGFTWSFHTCFTINSLMVKQPDIHTYGRIFSYAVIYFFNLVVIALWLIATTPVKADRLCRSFQEKTYSVYTTIYTKSVRIFKVTIWFHKWL
ncbi:MAG: hypothetical protein R6V06_08680 [Kiritimatiellia bacterium]